MTVSAITGASGAWNAQARAPRTPPPMTNTAQLLGLSTSQLSQDLQSGSTLSSLASKQGVSNSSLLSSIESDLKANAPQGAPALPSSQLGQIATSIANGTRPTGHHHHRGGNGAPPLTDTAQLLGLSTSQLSQDLQSGATLSSLASTQGVSSSSLLSSIESDLKTDAPQGASALSSSQLSQIATSIANGTPPARPGQDQGGTSVGGVTSARAQSNLSSLASALGTDPSALLSQLSSGQNLSSLLSANGDGGYGTSIANSTTGGVMVDQYA